MPRPSDPRALRPVHPNVGIAAAYRRRLDRLVAEMHRSVLYWVQAAYRAAPPHAQDELPASVLTRAVKRLRRRWDKRFAEAAPRLAEYFSTAVEERTAGALRSILSDAGVSVKFRMTPAMRDVVGATVQQSVQLIKSIPAQYLGQVEGIVMRSVQTGRDLKQVSSDLEQQLGVTRRRAALIARDQNNKATAAMTRARQLELGITEAIWMHSHAGREPRPTHVKAGLEKTRFNIAEGWYDPAVKKYIQPGELVNCRCTSKPILTGLGA